MSLFRDLFSSRRRSHPRVVVQWMVDVAVPDTEPQRWVGLFATDLSTQGIRLKGLDTDDVRGLLHYRGDALMKLRIPGLRPPLPLVTAELRWILGEKPNFHTGWLFAKIDANTLEFIDRFIADHPQDLLTDAT